jgi:MoxR-like ATPase
MAHKPYTGKTLNDKKAKPVDIPRKIVGDKKEPDDELQPYFPDPELVKAVNIALLLRRPLLVMGEPGCGKSLLAKDIAYMWYDKEMYQKDKYFEWNVKSTSKAREGLYEMDHLRRLRDSNRPGDTDDIKEYIIYGELANAMKSSIPGEKSVLLIDEIDKADIDFSNDLLNELERNAFTVLETKATEVYLEKPFIIITSNSEKDLSDAFLRRCVFHYIDLFSAKKLTTEEPSKWLKQIVQARHYNSKETDDPIIKKAIDTFLDLRKRMNIDSLTYRKSVSTSEFLDWFALLKQCKDDPAVAEASSLNDDFNSWMNKTDSKLPFGNALFKTTKSFMDLTAPKELNKV